MATVKVIFRQVQNSRSVETSWFFNNLTVAPGVAGLAEAIANAFNTNIKPAINGIQVEAISNVEIYAYDLANLAGAATITAAGAGSLAVDPADVLPTYLPIYFKRAVSAWYDVSTNLPYVGGKPGRNGRVFLPGLDERWVSNTGTAVPGALNTAFSALQDAIEDGFSAGSPSVHWNCVCYSPEKTVAENGYNRQALVGAITSFTLRKATRLDSRAD